MPWCACDCSTPPLRRRPVRAPTSPHPPAIFCQSQVDTAVLSVMATVLAAMGGAGQNPRAPTCAECPGVCSSGVSNTLACWMEAQSSSSGFNPCDSELASLATYRPDAAAGTLCNRNYYPQTQNCWGVCLTVRLSGGTFWYCALQCHCMVSEPTALIGRRMSCSLGR